MQYISIQLWSCTFIVAQREIPAIFSREEDEVMSLEECSASEKAKMLFSAETLWHSYDR